MVRKKSVATQQDFTKLKRELAKDRSIVKSAKTFKGIEIARRKAMKKTEKRINRFAKKFNIKR